MIQPGAGDPGNLQEARLPRRDWIVLPALSLLTICLLVTSTELIARRMFPASKTTGEDCMVNDHAATGARGIPNSVCWEKLPDGELTEYRFNSCGHRAGMECGPRSPGAYRVVMVGSSFAIGMRVPREKTFAALLPAQLAQRTGRKVELYNESMPWRPPHIFAMHFKEVLAAQPDLILWVLTPVDVRNESQEFLNVELPRAMGAQASASTRPTGFLPMVKAALTAKWLAPGIGDSLYPRQTVFLLRYCLYQSQSQYTKSYLLRGHDTEFLQAEPGAEWESRLRQLDSDAADMEAQARAAHVPLVAVLLPERAQAAMISMGEWPAGFDPYKLNAQVRSILVSHHATYADILPGFRQAPNPEQGYFPVDGHPDARGHALIARLLADELTGGAVPALASAASPRTAPAQER